MTRSQKSSYMQLLEQLNLEDIYIQQTFEFYFQRYGEREDMKYFVQHSPRIPDELRSHQFIGVCDRTLSNEVPKSRNLTGGAIRGTLQTVGLITPTGNELFRGCAVFPEFDDKGGIVAAVGYRFGDRVRHWQKGVIRWQKPALDAYVHDALAFVREVIYAKACH